MNWFQGQFHLSEAAPRETVCCLSPADAGGNAHLEASFSWRDGTFPGLAILPAPGRRPPLATKEHSAAEPQPEPQRSLNAEDAEVFAKERRADVFSARLRADLCVLCVKASSRIATMLGDSTARSTKQDGRSGQGNVGQGNGHKAVSWIPLTSIPLTSAPPASRAGSGVPLWLPLRRAVFFCGNSISEFAFNPAHPFLPPFLTLNQFRKPTGPNL